MSSAHRAIMGGVHPMHKISTVDMSADDIKAVLDQKPGCDNPVTKATEIKCCFMVFQRCPKGVSPVSCIVARPQSNNECSSLTKDVCRIASSVGEKIVGASFVNFAVDGVSLESDDVRTTICDFLSGIVDYLGSVDNKHNAKNGRTPLIGNSALNIGELSVDSDLLRQAKVSKALIVVKDFASDKNVEQLLSYHTLSLVAEAHETGRATGHLCDLGALITTMFFMRLHLHAINGALVPAAHRGVYLWMYLIWLTSIEGLHITPRRNLASETIANIFIVARDDVYQPSLTTSEPAEHQFGTGRNRVREFTCADYALHAERLNRQLEMLSKGELLPSRSTSRQYGYNAGYGDWFERARNMSEHTEGGPCKLNTNSNAPPISDQLWPNVQRLIHKSVDLMRPLLKVVGVADEKMSPFCKKFSTKDQLMNEYIKYCPRTFTYLDKCGEQDSDDNNESRENEDYQNNTEEVVMRLKTTLGEIQEHLHPQNSSSIDEVAVTKNNELFSEPHENRPTQTKESKRKKAHQKNEALKSAIYSLVNCRSHNDLLQLSLSASAIIDNTEEGSILNSRKAKSFHQRWFEKREGKDHSEMKCDSPEEEGALYIERDALIESKIKKGTRKKSNLVKKMYRVQSVLEKHHGKWWMTGERKEWSRSMMEDEKKKYKVRMRMVEEDVMGGYKDVSFTSTEYEIKDISRCVTGNEICGVLRGKYKYN